MGGLIACGKRADPLAPYVKTPQPPTALEVTQIGDEIEIRVTAPRTTTESRPLPVIQLEWLEGPASGDFVKGSRAILREEVAPGEVRIKRFKKPEVETRFSARAYSGNARSANVAPVAFKPVTTPVGPTGLIAQNTVNGVELHWVNPPGAEPWPTPSPSPSPSASPSVSPLPVPPTASAPASTVSPSPAPTETPSPTPTSTVAAQGIVGVTGTPSLPQAPPGASPSPRPTATPQPPTGIRIFRTDGTPRLAREPLQANSWTDTTVKTGDKPCYALRYFSSFKPLVESVPTEPVCVDVKDVIAPEPPPRVVADLGASFVEVSWQPSPSSDVAFYRVYRTREGGARTLVLNTDGVILRIRDNDVARGIRTYDVVSVDKSGNESAPSATFRINVP